MANASVHPVIRYVRTLAASPLVTALSDAELLRRFAAQRDEAAFAALVGRHGPLVLSACLRVLGDRHAAEDAFQSTFVVLARKAGVIQQPETLGPWLYSVATRTALKARGETLRRRQLETQAVVDKAVDPADDVVWRDLRPSLDEAIAALAECYRVPFVLHHLEGATVAEVARRLGCPQGTVATRLARAKQRLRSRLVRQGVTLSTAAFGAALSGNTVCACVPTALAAGVVEATLFVAAGKAAGVVSTVAIALTKGVFQAMTVTKLKVVTVLLALSAAGVGVSLHRQATTGPVRQARQNGKAADGGTASEAVAVPGDAQAGGAPAFGRHYAGGFRSLRGFEFRGAGREAVGCEPFGEFRFLNSLEYQVPVSASDMLYCVPFVDGGTVESGTSEKKDYRVSPGCGLRFVVPMSGPAPVALDFGFPVVTKPADPKEVFSFWVGFFG
jgi:RNA polymerase sigma factor (sigma-70 family)